MEVTGDPTGSLKPTPRKGNQLPGTEICSPPLEAHKKKKFLINKTSVIVSNNSTDEYMASKKERRRGREELGENYGRIPWSLTVSTALPTALGLGTSAL